MVVAKPGDLELVGAPTDEQLSEISLGQPVLVTFVGADNKPKEGVVARVPLIGNDANQDSASRARAVRIELKEKIELKSGEIARINTFIARKENVLWIPPAALRSYRARKFVVVREATGLERRVDVKIGLESLDRVEIQDGLKEGDVIVSP